MQVYYKRGDVPDLRAYESRLLEIRYCSVCKTFLTFSVGQNCKAMSTKCI